MWKVECESMHNELNVISMHNELFDKRELIVKPKLAS